MNAEIRRAGLDALFRPGSIAVIGASDDPRKIGGRPIRYMLEAKSAVKVYPVNPTRSQVQGLTAYPTAAAIPDQVDQAIIAVPARQAEAAVADACAAGVRSIVMFSAGFAEAGDEGAAAQTRIMKMIRDAGARMIGPNAMGSFNTVDRVFSTFSTAMDRGTPAVGRVGMVSQSGAVGSYLQNLVISRGMAISKFVATGNEADVQAAECLEWMAQDPDTDVLMLYMEGCRNGPALIGALRTARRMKKPVIVFKAGRTEAGQTVAASHTGALAGSVQVFDAVLREAGVYSCQTLTEMVDVTYACAQGRLPVDKTLAIVTVSGGVGVMSTDAAMEAGIALPPVSEATLAEIQKELPLAVGLNPVDTTAQTVGDRAMLTRAVERVLRDRPFGSAMLFFANAGRNARDMEILSGPLRALRAEFPETQLALCVQTTPEFRSQIEELGYLVFEDPVFCVKALAAAAELSAVRRRPLVTPQIEALAPVVLTSSPDEARSKELLAAAGLHFAQERVAANADEAAAAAEAMGYPVVLKVLSPQIAHKSEVGGVALNLADATAVRAAFDRVVSNAAAAAPAADIRGVTVAQMIRGGTQTIIGAHRDPTFGPVVMFGLGGIYTEVLKDTVLRTAPVTHEAALEMIRSIRAFAILDGARGQEKADLDAIAGAIVRVSQFIAAQGPEVESVEINPFIALPEGGVGVDALIQVKA
ncbi:acyl-CoA synthetase (NDP forming) [Pseudochelatococcus lubricantis]|uniref:Acyl-CoA synthetase (NDP forming) n=1 Tax=Pseudochelatococcus lubricantis TaxID=1538102 RepID=A0ABX0V155_9HYPH|nr:acetate--CoA ligase family protein [Pseudochelatococcus lubricantis]NIJ58924.1 acyl-CoA synthetase (NDP forming) [Pseudochelatococcus lubricantis]